MSSYIHKHQDLVQYARQFPQPEQRWRGPHSHCRCRYGKRSVEQVESSVAGFASATAPLFDLSEAIEVQHEMEEV